MATTLRPLLISSLFVSFLLHSAAQSCLKYKFLDNKNFTYCDDLPYLNSYIHYTHNATDGSLQFAYRHTGISKGGKWVAWAINPLETGMHLAQAFVAYLRANGELAVYTSNLLDRKPTLKATPIMLSYKNLSATFANSEIVIFATVILPENRTVVNQLWQEGPLKNDVPRMHDTALPNMMSRGNLDVLLGRSTFNKTIPENAVQRKKTLHARFNVLGWGIMMPIGTMLARYLRVIESANEVWIYIHITWQSIAYIIGVTGSILGIQIGSTIRLGKNQVHRVLSYMLFFLATLQMLALFLRPKKDSKYRPYWSIYHRVLGHTIVIIAIINVFKGIGVLRPTINWMRNYFGIIFVMFFIAIFMELYIQKLKEKKNQMLGIVKNPHIQLGYNANNGYESRNRYPI